MELYNGSENAKSRSFMWEHTQAHHSGIIGDSDYEIKLTGTHTTPLDRIMDEAVRIKNLQSEANLNQTTKILNGKSEYFQAEYFNLHINYSKGPSEM